jgi:hypothetical protein
MATAEVDTFLFPKGQTAKAIPLRLVEEVALGELAPEGREHRRDGGFDGQGHDERG